MRGSFLFRVGWRYLFANKAQTALLLFGVAIGVMVYVYISSLINGLRDLQINLVTGQIAHVVLEPSERKAALMIDVEMQADRSLLAVQPPFDQREQVRNPDNVIRLLEGLPFVTVVSPEVVGAGTLIRSQTQKSISVVGLLPEHLNSIAQIGVNVVSGEALLDLDGLLIGDKLAEELSLQVGQTLVLRSDRTREVNRVIRGIFSTGIDSIDQRVVYMNLRAARNLYDLENGVSRLQVRIQDLYEANEAAQTLRALTRLKSTSWIESNPRLFEAIAAQGTSGLLIRSFSMVTIVIGVASALLLSTYRRRSEIGIMLSMGVSKRFIMGVFLVQGLFIGFLGAVMGALMGFGLGHFLLSVVGTRANGTPLLPIDPLQGDYVQVIVLTTLGSVLAALLPARSATKVDPVEVIGP